MADLKVPYVARSKRVTFKNYNHNWTSQIHLFFNCPLTLSTRLGKAAMAKAESSAAAAKNGINANVNAVGSASYDLPWYSPPPTLSPVLIASQG